MSTCRYSITPGRSPCSATSRSIFAVQAASTDPKDTRIVFEVAASNDCPPDYLREYGSRSAWHRANAAFERCHDFDWAAWDGERDKAPEAAVTIDIVQGCMATGEWIRPAILVKALMDLDPPSRVRRPTVTCRPAMNLACGTSSGKTASCG